MFTPAAAGTPVKITNAADFSLKATGNLSLTGFLCSTSSSWNVSIYDGVDNTGTLLVDSMVLAAGTPYPMPFLMRKGIFFHTNSGTGSGALIYG